MNNTTYWALYDNSSKLLAVGTGHGGTEITEAEYNELLTMIRTKASLVNQLYNGEITIDNVPTEWQEEIQRRVDERIELEGTLDNQDISSEEFYSMIEEVL